MKVRALAAVAVLLVAAGCSGGHARKLTAAGHSSSTTAETTTTVGAEATTTTGGVATAPPTTARTGAASQPRSTPTTARASAAPTTEPPNLSNDNTGIEVVTEADNGKTFTVHRGTQGIEVQLSNDNVWTEPQASSAQVLTRSSGSANSDGSAQATFMAAGDGTTTVSSDGRSQPQPCQTANPPCMVPDHIVQFRVTVNVVG